MVIEWTGTALDDMADLEKGVARRVAQSVERFAESGVGDYRVLFEQASDTMRILRVRNRSEAYR
jgi:phage-related protein